MTEWYENLGLDTEPFQKPALTCGNEEVLKEVFYSIYAGNMMFVEGPSGSGKTNLLREALKRFGGKKKIIYVNCKKISKELNIERLIKDRYGILGRIFNMKPRNMILLLDEIEHLSEKNCERIKYYYDLNYLRSVIFTGKDCKKSGLNKSILQRLHKTVMLKPLSEFEAVKAAREKIGDSFLTDRQLKEIYNVSQKNMGTYMANCRKVLREMGLQKKKSISDNEIPGMLVGIK